MRRRSDDHGRLGPIDLCGLGAGGFQLQADLLAREAAEVRVLVFPSLAGGARFSQGGSRLAGEGIERNHADAGGNGRGSRIRQGGREPEMDRLRFGQLERKLDYDALDAPLLGGLPRPQPHSQTLAPIAALHAQSKLDLIGDLERLAAKGRTGAVGSSLPQAHRRRSADRDLLADRGGEHTGHRLTPQPHGAFGRHRQRLPFDRQFGARRVHQPYVHDLHRMRDLACPAGLVLGDGMDRIGGVESALAGRHREAQVRGALGRHFEGNRRGWLGPPAVDDAQAKRSANGGRSVVRQHDADRYGRFGTRSFEARVWSPEVDAPRRTGRAQPRQPTSKSIIWAHPFPSLPGSQVPPSVRCGD